MNTPQNHLSPAASPNDANTIREQSFWQTQWVGFSTIVVKEIIRFLRIWVQTLLPPIITTTLYFVIFGNLIGGRIGEMSGFSYIQFITPGLIMMSVINNSFGNVVSSFYGARFQGYVDEMLVSPLSNALMILGYIAGGILRALLAGFFVTCIAMFFTKLRIYDIGITAAVVILSAALFSIAGFLNALFANSFDDIAIVPTFLLTPLTYLGGVFYSISLLPPFWEGLSKLNPILYMVNTFRYGMLGVSDIPVQYALGIILAVTIGLYIVALALVNRGVGIRK